MKSTRMVQSAPAATVPLGKWASVGASRVKSEAGGVASRDGEVREIQRGAS